MPQVKSSARLQLAHEPPDLARVPRQAAAASGARARAAAHRQRPLAQLTTGTPRSRTRRSSSPGGQATTAGSGSAVTMSARKRAAPPLRPL